MKKTSKILLLVIVTMFMSFMLFSNSVFADTDLVTASTGEDDYEEVEEIDEETPADEEKTETEKETKTEKEKETTAKGTDKTKNETTPEKISQTGSFTAVTYITIAGVAVLTLAIAATRIKKYNF